MSIARFTGFTLFVQFPRAYARGFMLSPSSMAEKTNSRKVVLILIPQILLFISTKFPVEPFFLLFVEKFADAITDAKSKPESW